MEIFRHYYTAAENNTANFFKQHMNNFGFCNLDGSKINWEWNYDSTINMRYKLDTKKQSYLTLSTSNYYYYGYKWFRALCDLQFHASNGTTYNPISRSGTNSSTGSPSTLPATVVFLPLKNNGFLLNIRSLNGVGNYYSTDLTSSNDSRDFTFCLATPTPSLNTKVYGTNCIAGSYNANTSCVSNLIGIPPCKYNQNWTYIYYSDSPYYSWWDGGSTRYNGRYYRHLIDFGNGKVQDMPFKSNFIREYDSPISAYNEPTYSNINENICSMIKLPYDNGYIDGVYLLTTAPQQLEDATFFSFDGRNFLNAFDNYVFELPPSTT